MSNDEQYYAPVSGRDDAYAPTEPVANVATTVGSATTAATERFPTVTASATGTPLPPPPPAYQQTPVARHATTSGYQAVPSSYVQSTPAYQTPGASYQTASPTYQTAPASYQTPYLTTTYRQVGDAYQAPLTTISPSQPVPYVHAGARRQSVFPAALAAGLIGALLASGLTAAFMQGRISAANHPVTLPVITQANPGRVDDPLTTNSTISNPVWQEVISSVADSVVAIQASTPGGGSFGSGFIIDTAGHVLTNNHVVQGAANNRVEVTMSDGRLYIGDILGTDSVTDLALLQLQNHPDDLRPVALGDSDEVRVGDAVLAVGNPLGLTNTATTGIVSALDRPVTAGGIGTVEVTTTNAIQIDAAVNPGNSGGPVFDATGRVIGVTSSIASVSALDSQAGSIGLGFAIPINLVKSVTEQLLATGSAEHAFMGVTIQPGTATADGVTRRGASIGTVQPDSPAAQAGLQTGDVIIAINGRPVNSHESVTAYVREHRAGDTILVTFIRNETLQETSVTLATLGDQPTGIVPVVPTPTTDEEED